MRFRNGSIAVAATVFLLFESTLIASEPVGVFAMIEKVVFEPNEKSPERIQVWGGFEFAQLNQPVGVSAPKYGYLYFKLPDANQQAAKTEWADLKAVAGTGQAIGFGNFWLSSPFSSIDAPRGNPVFVFYPPGREFNDRIQIDVRVRPASEPPSNPAFYSTNAGVVKLAAASHGNVINQLKEALRKR